MAFALNLRKGVALLLVLMLFSLARLPAREDPKADVLLSEALRSLGESAGLRIEDRRDQPDLKISVKPNSKQFWPSLDAIARASDSRVYLYPRDGRIALLKRDADYVEPPISYDGPFRIAVKRVSAARDLDTKASTYIASLEVAWEPRVQPFFLETRPQSLLVKDDKGNSLPVSTEGSAPAPVDGRISLVFDLPLPSLPRSVTRIGLLEGKLSLIAPSKTLSFSFDALSDLAAAKPTDARRNRTEENVACRISKVTLADDRWTVQVTLDYPPSDVKFDSYQSWVVNNEMTLVSKDGSRRLASAGYVVEASSERRAVVSYHFTDKDKTKHGKPEDWKVTYKTPAAIEKLSVSFSFKDVPLP
jgi:hypothetical protein